mmetsp:Transcript_28800/g.51692  ORF Transcript_28800/g.51692 Transcript_28800/m.51692 type:complete len:426 (+) Transcript_28800:1707-2984(+)
MTISISMLSVAFTESLKCTIWMFCFQSPSSEGPIDISMPSHNSRSNHVAMASTRPPHIIGSVNFCLNNLLMSPSISTVRTSDSTLCSVKFMWIFRLYLRMAVQKSPNFETLKPLTMGPTFVCPYSWSLWMATTLRDPRFGTVVRPAPWNNPILCNSRGTLAGLLTPWTTMLQPGGNSARGSSAPPVTDTYSWICACCSAKPLALKACLKATLREVHAFTRHAARGAPSLRHIMLNIPIPSSSKEDQNASFFSAFTLAIVSLMAVANFCCSSTFLLALKFWGVNTRINNSLWRKFVLSGCDAVAFWKKLTRSLGICALRTSTAVPGSPDSAAASANRLVICAFFPPHCARASLRTRMELSCSPNWVRTWDSEPASDSILGAPVKYRSRRAFSKQSLASSIRPRRTRVKPRLYHAMEWWGLRVVANL